MLQVFEALLRMSHALLPMPGPNVDRVIVLGIQERVVVPRLREAALMSFQTKLLSSIPDAIAPDGSEVRILCQTDRGSMAHFTLPPRAISRAAAHRTVEEVWYFVSGHGRMWRRLGSQDEITEVGPGTSITIPVGAQFQFRSDGDESLAAVGVTMPPWPGEAEAYAVEGCWQPTV